MKAKYKKQAKNILLYLKSLKGKEIARADLLRHFSKGEFSFNLSIYPYGKKTTINERAISYLYNNKNIKRKIRNNKVFLSFKMDETEFNYCDDCNKEIGDEDYYMVKDKLWIKFASKCRHLCINCFEKRLGRPLIKLDFSDCILNNSFLRLSKREFK